eukprot:CAMPEP_0201869602 /NCGR_PEP_ID=MMETSP0902-20130614/3060_1 /ASSEMBLY_ACC=CAM_ASM_000551 /TAXON_ID=420261 /ORGANISM="Thalassiosira antarctica, Strain CCMP982" /LENGTH=97 /DNA_ID=CAMNT_0048395137 /DNA_START=384 /DNA_END=676 /DNA_ORIENTATION=+
MAVKDGWEENGTVVIAPSQQNESIHFAEYHGRQGGGGANGGGGGSPDGHHHGPDDMVAWDPESSVVNNPLSPMAAGGGDGRILRGLTSLPPRRIYMW